jgi:hypothetical protein
VSGLSKIPSILECILLIAVAMSFSISGIMAIGTPVVQPIGLFSNATPSVGQPVALFSGVLPSVGINQGKGLFSGQLPTPTVLGSLNATRKTIQLDQAMPSVSSIPEGLNIPPVVTKPLNLTVPIVATKPQNATNPVNTTQPLNTTMS